MLVDKFAELTAAISLEFSLEPMPRFCVRETLEALGAEPKFLAVRAELSRRSTRSYATISGPVEKTYHPL
jgi:hypothetical protein